VSDYKRENFPDLNTRNIMSRTRKEILEERRRLTAEYGELFDRIAALLFRRDPIRIGADAPAEE